jgi:glycerophosphoryl diester phosphodiesterase
VLLEVKAPELYPGIDVDVDKELRSLSAFNAALGDVPDAALVDLIHSYGPETHVWTVNDATNMRKAIRFGVDGVITNFPQLLRDVLRNG